MKPVKEVFADGINRGFAVFKGGKWHWFSDPEGPDGGRKLYPNDESLFAGVKETHGATEVHLEDGMRD